MIVRSLVEYIDHCYLAEDTHSTCIKMLTTMREHLVKARSFSTEDPEMSAIVAAALAEAEDIEEEEEENHDEDEEEEIMFSRVDVSEVFENTRQMEERMRSWQNRCLTFQESIFFTLFVCCIVLYELIYVHELKKYSAGNQQTMADYATWVISLFFFLEIVLRMYVHNFVYQSWCGFFGDPFRLVDFLLVVLDLFVYALLIAAGTKNTSLHTMRLLRR